ncbi:gibberellin-regulated protein 12-like, partial [Herrania umbratica]|uniref:Gibberellin-regulated protein 12-like n=1 Tax=Herrania umbratica TaxID=108875 RepID=A0A6J1AXD4_9ROSI
GEVHGCCRAQTFLLNIIASTSTDKAFPLKTININMARLCWLPFAFFLILALSFTIQTANAGKEGSLHLEDCPKACDVRCSKTHHRKPCLFFCDYCCKRCLCVPSGTYGNREECPCYNNIKTKEGKNKCP